MPDKIIPRREKPDSDEGYFEVLSKAVFQAGFSFKVVESKWPSIRQVFYGFDFRRVAEWSDLDIINALDAPDIIRNRRKIAAIVENAQTFSKLVDEHGSFGNYLDSLRDEGYGHLSKQISKQFKWLGKTGTYVFLYTTDEEVPAWEKR